MFIFALVIIAMLAFFGGVYCWDSIAQSRSGIRTKIICFFKGLGLIGLGILAILTAIKRSFFWGLIVIVIIAAWWYFFDTD